MGFFLSFFIIVVLYFSNSDYLSCENFIINKSWDVWKNITKVVVSSRRGWFIISISRTYAEALSAASKNFNIFIFLNKEITKDIQMLIKFKKIDFY